MKLSVETALNAAGRGMDRPTARKGQAVDGVAFLAVLDGQEVIKATPCAGMSGAVPSLPKPVAGGRFAPADALKAIVLPGAEATVSAPVQSAKIEVPLASQEVPGSSASDAEGTLPGQAVAKVGTIRTPVKAARTGPRKPMKEILPAIPVPHAAPSADPAPAVETQVGKAPPRVHSMRPHGKTEPAETAGKERGDTPTDVATPALPLPVVTPAGSPPRDVAPTTSELVTGRAPLASTSPSTGVQVSISAGSEQDDAEAAKLKTSLTKPKMPLESASEGDGAFKSTRRDAASQTAKARPEIIESGRVPKMSPAPHAFPGEPDAPRPAGGGTHGDTRNQALHDALAQQVPAPSVTKATAQTAGGGVPIAQVPAAKHGNETPPRNDAQVLMPTAPEDETGPDAAARHAAPPSPLATGAAGAVQPILDIMQSHPAQGTEALAFHTVRMDHTGAGATLAPQHGTHLVAVPASEARPVAQQLATAYAARFDDRRIELTLSPEELGRVRMVIHHDAQVMNVTIHAERPETLDLMRRHAEVLAQEFRAQGYGGTAFAFTGGGAQTGQHQAGPGAALDRTTADPSSMGQSAQAASGAGPYHRAAADGLDLRL